MKNRVFRVALAILSAALLFVPSMSFLMPLDASAAVDTAITPVAGDINADGVFDVRDVTLLLQWLSEWDVTIRENYADVDNDGDITVKDVTLMLKYQAEWDVEMYLPEEEVIDIYDISEKLTEEQVKTAISNYKIVRPADAEKKILDAIELLNGSIESTVGARLDVVTDEADATGLEIMFGAVERDSASDGVKKLAADEVNYGIYVDSDGNIVLAGVDADRVYYAAEDTAAIYFGYRNFSNIHLLKSGKEYNATGHEKFTFRSSDSAFNVVQGAYFDGESYYIAIISKLDGGYEDARILELDADGNKIRESDVLKLDHANNITYNPTSGMLVVTNCQAPEGHYNYLTMVDRETLTVSRYGKLDYPFFALAYSPELKKYASGQWGGETLNVWNYNFDPLLVVDVEMPGSLSQGCFCDAEGIYFVRSSQNGYPSEIRIYDWGCDLVRSVPISLGGSVEPENINIVDGRVYVTGNDWSVPQGIAYTVTFAEQSGK